MPLRAGRSRNLKCCRYRWRTLWCARRAG